MSELVYMPEYMVPSEVSLKEYVRRYPVTVNEPGERIMLSPFKASHAERVPTRSKTYKVQRQVVPGPMWRPGQIYML